MNTGAISPRNNDRKFEEEISSSNPSTYTETFGEFKDWFSKESNCVNSVSPVFYTFSLNNAEPGVVIDSTSGVITVPVNTVKGPFTTTPTVILTYYSSGLTHVYNNIEFITVTCSSPCCVSSISPPTTAF